MPDSKFQIRMPQELHERLAEAAQQSHRSMNSEIVARLQNSFGVPVATISDQELEQLVDRAVARQLAKREGR